MVKDVILKRGKFLSKTVSLQVEQLFCTFFFFFCAQLPLPEFFFVIHVIELCFYQTPNLVTEIILGTSLSNSLSLAISIL